MVQHPSRYILSRPPHKGTAFCLSSSEISLNHFRSLFVNSGSPQTGRGALVFPKFDEKTFTIISLRRAGQETPGKYKLGTYFGFRSKLAKNATNKKKGETKFGKFKFINNEDQNFWVSLINGLRRC